MSYTEFILQAGLLVGYILIFVTIFAESGLLIGFMLPGDSFLLALGLLAAKGTLNLPAVLILGTLGAILGDSVGYATGRKFGRTLFNRPNSRFFRKEHLEKAEAFYKEHGKKTIVLARFTPIVRTFAPIVAGTAHMPYGTFLAYNIVGGIGWVWSIVLLGYFMGTRIPNIDHYVLPAIVVIIILSFLPALKHIIDARRKVK